MPISLPLSFRSLALPLAVGVVAAVLAGCVGGPSGGGGLAPGLTQAINTPGAQMDRSAALAIINQYRAVRGVSALGADAALDAQAQTLASQYASTGRPPSLPSGLVAMRLSAGYENFAETFSGWRNSPADADVLASGQARRAGFAVVYNPNSAYGTHWVMVLAQ
ncbi:CAP domain-containing protein [Pelagibacterium limicola]|uniref:CAP domain-containing protein n=1 Tax=Pelagibacterium limicola TaxID=2791022 RepID=UPI0018AFAA04|nr:CAP domain-containing protein [Pelagibacterium limicola]